MELVRGQTLDQILRRHGQLSEKLALQVVGHMAVAVSVAHAAGIVHRDLKPSNILLDGDKGLKVSDLGLARENASPGVTMATGLVGTPHFMAPETWEPGKDPDPRSDLYSMGVILYQMLFARLPFVGSPTQILKGHVSSTPPWDPPEGGYRPANGTMTILRRLMEKDPAKRFQSAALVAEACRQMLADMARASAGADRGPSRAADSGSDSQGLLRRMESRLEASTIQGGRRILHTTGRERILLWILLLSLVAGAVAGWILR
jgi:serine/threonine-protein kinase